MNLLTKSRTFLATVALILAASAVLHAQDKPARYTIGEDGAWWGIDYREPLNAPEAKDLPRISVDGNRFVNPDGETVLFRGLSFADPDLLEVEGHWNRELFEQIAGMGANLLRIPVHPAAWRRRGTDDYLRLLEEAVRWATELEMYVIIDWHSIGNLKTELFQHPIYDTTHGETNAFWRTIARHFTGHNTVAFYELFNEPTMYRGQLGRVTWPEWKEMMENLITIVRHYDGESIPLVAGFDWAYDLNHIRYNPIQAEDIAYVSHPYPWKRQPPYEPRWEENFAFAAEQYPVIATEIGFELEEGDVIDDDHYANRITRFLESRGISWVGWVFDPDWHPQLLKDWDYNLTKEGEFFKEALQRPPAKPPQP